MPRLLSVAVCAAVLAAASLASTSASAGTVGLHLASVHTPARHFNNSNPGLYYRTDSGWIAGAYRNSLRRTSAYAGYTWSWKALAVTGGMVTGYSEHVQPLLVPSVLVFHNSTVGVRVAFIPRVEKRIESHVFHLSVEF
ncbi:MAG TPA: hypothetical protein VGP22_07365 [Albitalea sp.]|jgi:hypothetical protein|nr:hypothetical protein [Albitalea sp.]